MREDKIMTLEVIKNIWDKFIAFSEIVLNFLNSPLNVAVENTVGRIPILGDIIGLIVKIIPDYNSVSIIDFILQAGISTILIIAIIKFIIGIFK